ncbi:hypothetical protein, partial [Klebsiella pneumoniae]|uniref:hypothetical protein n=1 Tax=Klebsiella pneumoniae TaxID=573 RepID=UPI003D7D1890
TRGCNPTSSKFIHTWLRFGEIMRGSLSATPLICTLPLSAIWMFNEGVDSLSQGWKTEVVLRTLPVKSYKSGFDGFALKIE